MLQQSQPGSPTWIAAQDAATNLTELAALAAQKGARADAWMAARRSMSWGLGWDIAYDSALSAGMTSARAAEAANARADAGKRTYPDSRSGPGNGGPPKWRKDGSGGGRTGRPGGAGGRA